MDFTKISKSPILFENQTSLRTLELSNTSQICPRLQKRPWKDRGGRNWVLVGDRQRSLPDSGEVAAGVGGERVGEPPEAHLGTICMLGGGREALSGGGHRHRRVAVVVLTVPVRWRLPWKCGRVGEL
jgi:hypothetical protein